MQALWKKVTDLLVTRFLRVGPDAVVKVKTTSTGAEVEISPSELVIACNPASAVETVAATNVITADESGKTFFLSSTTEFVSTLPAPAAGLKFTFIVAAAPSGASYTVVSNGTTQNVIHGVGISSADAGGSASGTNGTAVDVITFVDGQSKVGDRVDLVCDGTLWYATAAMFDEDAITFS